MPFQKGHLQYSSHRFPKGHSPWNKGKKLQPLSKEHKKKIGEALKGKKPKNLKKLHSLGGRAVVGKKNGEWKGSDVGYRALHHWVVRHLGTPDICEDCGLGGLFGKKIHWANKSGKYKRDLKDWVRLCSKCHKCYDKNMKGGH